MIKELIFGGFLALKEYIALHILACFIPVFLLAGAMVSFISKKYLTTSIFRLYSTMLIELIYKKGKQRL